MKGLHPTPVGQSYHVDRHCAVSRVAIVGMVMFMLYSLAPFRGLFDRCDIKQDSFF